MNKYEHNHTIVLGTAILVGRILGVPTTLNNPILFI